MGTANDRPRSGRSRITARRQDRYMRLTHLCNRFRTAVLTAQVTPGTHNNRISQDIVGIPFQEFGLRPRRPCVGMSLTPHGVMSEWRGSHNTGQTCFSFVNGVKLCFLMGPGTSCIELTAYKGVHALQRELSWQLFSWTVDQFGVGVIMVWASLSNGHATPLVFSDGGLTAQGYVGVILRPVVVSFVRQHNVTFQ